MSPDTSIASRPNRRRSPAIPNPAQRNRHLPGILAAMAALLLLLPAFGSRAAAQAADSGAAVNAGPDLVITSITLTPADPGAGGTADIEVVVKNQGDASTTGGFNIYLYVEPTERPPDASTDYTIFAGYNLPLAPDGTFKYTRTGQTFSASPPVVFAWVDPPWDNRVVESDEDNNLFPDVVSNGDEYEDDDTCSGAKEATVGATAQERNLFREPDADVDWIKFTGESGVTYVAEAEAVGADADLAVELFDRCDGPPSFGSGAKVQFTAPATGTYYIKVSHAQAEYGPDNAYRFQVTGNTNCTNYLEPNNSCVASADLPLGVAQTHTFCDQGDTDWLKFAVIAGTQYKVTVTNEGENADVRLGLFMACDENNSTASGQSLEFTAPETGSIYVKAAQTDAAIHGPGTDYSITAERIGGEGCTEDSHEQDDTLANAVPLASDGTRQTHNICPAEDSDWVKFSAERGTSYTIETLNLAAAADSYICLYTANGDQIACDDDSGPGTGARILWEPPTSGTYFVEIRDVSNTVAGSETQYDLRIFPGSCQTDSHEEDSSQETARNATVGGAATTHNFCPTGDEDWLRFNGAQGKSYLIETTDPGPEADTLVELLDADGNLLALNDDHTPGTTSLVAFSPPQSGDYFVKVRQYNPAYIGAGTEYAVGIREGTVTPTPTPTATVTPTPTPTPNPSAVRTLILVNHTRFGQVHDGTAAEQVLAKANQLAQADNVKGEVIRLDNNTETAAAYAIWTSDPNNNEKANMVTAAIRSVVTTYLAEREGIEYLVIVGDDRVIPMRRILDTTPRFSELTYSHVAANHPTGAALKGNYFLSDDYFSDKEPSDVDGREIYVPDLATGRLIETPEEIMGQVDTFLAQSTLAPQTVLISGYDFVQDVATEDCDDWNEDFGESVEINCSLIGESWTGASFRSLQLRPQSPFLIQSISGHATHYAEGAPVGNAIIASEVVEAPFRLMGGLIYTPGCHAGLNVPPNNADNPIDLPQAFVGKGANYIGNTGYGWGLRSALGLSEKLIRLFTRGLLRGTSAEIGKSLMNAKSLYLQQDQDFSSYDEKVLQQVVLYGLPMYAVETGGVLDIEDEPFPGVGFQVGAPLGSLGGSDLVTGTVNIDFSTAENLDLAETTDGDYYQLNGSIHAVPGQPIQPLFFGEVTTPNYAARGVLLMNATFTVQKDFDPVVAVPFNEYDTANLETPLANPNALYPPMPVSLQHRDGQSHLVTQLGQYDAATDELRLYENLGLELYYSTDLDTLSPEATVIDGITPRESNRVEVKVGAVDSSGVERVVLSYIQDINLATNQLQSKDLTLDVAAQKWVGTFEGDAKSRFLVQIVDKAGNITTSTNKGQYFKPGVVEAALSDSVCDGECIFLPMLLK